MPRLHDPAVKSAVLAALLAGMAAPDVARTYKVPVRTVHNWAEAAFGTKSENGSARPAWLPEKITDLRGAFEAYLVDSMHALRVQVALLSDPERLGAADIGDVIRAHEAIADRVARIAEGVGRLEIPAAPDPDHTLDAGTT